MFNCNCGKSYVNKRSLRKHERISLTCMGNRELSAKQKYALSPKKCNNCQKTIPYEKRENNFCNSSCSAIKNNKRSNTIQKTYNFSKVKKNIETKPMKKCVNCFKETKNSLFCSLDCNANYKLKIRCENVEKGIASPRVCKNYLIAKYGNTCLDKDCAWDFTKRPIKVELEHIDGNAENNNLNNLTLLCPNCHSLTSTYKSKNSGNGRSKRMERYRQGKSY